MRKVTFFLILLVFLLLGEVEKITAQTTGEPVLVAELRTTGSASQSTLTPPVAMIFCVGYDYQGGGVQMGEPPDISPLAISLGWPVSFQPGIATYYDFDMENSPTAIRRSAQPLWFLKLPAHLEQQLSFEV